MASKPTNHHNLIGKSALTMYKQNLEKNFIP